jgi:[glutamine synthetase] adenylyltransferase / [glutamine synthetase]-adenylyl-L-tyrosine phosphorylase
MTVVDSAPIRRALDRSADPLTGRAALARLVEAHPSLRDDLGSDSELLDAIVAVSVASHSLLSVLERDETAIAMLHAAALHTPKTMEELVEEAGLLLAREDPSAELRRWKHRQLVRIAGRDLLGIAELRTVGAELAGVAQACLGAALAIAAPTVPMAVIGMGKLGGVELNYSSDVDVVFVHDGDAAEAERAARALMRVMTEPTRDGIVFRTDADLRPEGRSGALSRTIEAYTSYWERWAQAWELQALIKARPVAGDLRLADAFVAGASPFVWPDVLDPSAVHEIRAMKTRTEQMLTRRGLENRELKRGYGGIRDIEFAIQLLQLVHGRHDDSIRARATLDALEQLAGGGYVTIDDARQLDAAYVWLRTVEHRLQLVDEHQTHTLPADTEARTHLARVLGFRDRPGESALEQLDAEQQRHQTIVRAIHEKLFFAPILDTLAGVGALSMEAAQERLIAFGFRDVEQTRAALEELTAGLTRRSRVMQQLLPAILGWLSAAPDPDLGLLALRRLTEGYNRSSTLARRFRESPIAAERTCRILGSSRILGGALYRQPSFVDVLADDSSGTNAALAGEATRRELVTEALDSLDWREDDAGRRSGLRRFKRRHLLRIGARDVLGFATLDTAGRELSCLADACVEGALRSLEPTLPFAVIGLGRLGGAELSYASDVDVIFVYDGKTALDFVTAERTATQLVRAIGDSTAEGRTFRVDTRLRPEGAQGPLARSLGGYETYFAQWAQTWEFQALTKARFVAGDVGLGAQFVELAHRFVYRDPFPEEWRREVRRMKARIERERIPPGEDPQFHLKLGRGSLSDIEFTVQLEQLAHGGTHPEVREPSTLRALDLLVAIGAISAEDAEPLRESFVLCEQARNYRYLLTGSPSDALPVDGEEAEKLARMLGYTHRPQQSLRDDYRRVTRRARAIVERIFYARTD